MRAFDASSFGRRLALRVWRLLERAGLRAGARFDVEPMAGFRSDAYLYLALCQAGTVRLPRDKLYALQRQLDFRSYLGLLLRARATAAPDAVRVSEAVAPAGAAPGLLVSRDYYGAGAALPCPYFLHPALYADGTYRRLSGLARKTRRFRLAFAGTAGRAAYSDGFEFPVLNRHAVVEFVLDTFRAETCLVERREDVPRLSRTDRPIVVVRTGDTRDVLDKHPLGQAQYLRLLGDSEFALCPPGSRMPHSHNIVEAMGVRAIPVTNYAGYMRPPLAPGANCLGFDTRDELAGAVRRALTAPAAEVGRLRAGVGEYASAELAVTAFGAKLRAAAAAAAGAPVAVCVNDEGRSIELWRARARADKLC